MGLRLYAVLLAGAAAAPVLIGTAGLLAYVGGAIEVVAAAAALLFVVAVAVAYAIGIRVGSAIASIRDAALALAGDAPMPRIDTVVREVEEVARALDTAALRIRARSEERDRAAADLLESEKRSQDFAAASSDWFWEMGTDLEAVKVIGRGGERYAEAEIARRSFHWRSQVPDDAAAQGMLANFRARRPFRDFTMEFRRDGRLRYIKISGVPHIDGQGVFRGYRGTGADVTRDQEHEAHARLIEERFMQALENINEGFALYDAGERLVACNERYKRIHLRNGRDPDSAVPRLGMTIKELYMLRARNGLYEVPPGQSLEAFAEAKLANFRAFREHWYWQTADGRWLHIGTARTKDGGSVALWTDLTDLKAAEEQRRKLEGRLEHSQKIESLGTLAGGVAHDLNNILVPIMALTKITAARLPEGSKDRLNLQRVLRASERARDLVGQILAFSRKDGAAKQELDLEEVARDALHMLRASIPSTIRIDEQIEPVTPLYGDPGQLHQVLINLVTNAAHAIGERTGVITVGLRAASAVEGEAEHVLLTVKDTGCGMDEATRSRIFDPFFTTKPVGEGTGLGLSVVHGIVAAHGGHIEVRSRPGEGSEFRVSVPVAEGAAASGAARPATVPADYFAGPAWGLFVSPKSSSS